MSRAVAAAVALLAGCTPAPSGVPDAAAPADLASRPPPDLTDGDGGAACNDPERSRLPGTTCVAYVRGKIVDEKAAPVGKVVLSVCGAACFYGESRADGTFDVEVRTHIDLAFWALSLHARPDRAGYYVQLPTPKEDWSIFAIPLPLPRFPASGPLLALDKRAQQVTSNGVTLSLPAGTEINLDVEDVALMDVGRQFRVFVAPDPKMFPFVDAKSPPVALYSFTPFESTFSKPVTLSFPNSSQAPPGTRFDVLALRTLLVTLGESSGTWKRVAGATVNQAGDRITFDPGAGVEFLSWIALVRK